MKNSILLVFILLFNLTIQGQETPKTWIKVNAPALLVAIPQIGLEHHFNPSWSYQADLLGSFWKSVKGAPLQIGMLSNELRYYPAHKPTKWFIGLNLSGAKYRMQKWNYWGSDYIQEGQSVFMGLTGGYSWYFHKNLKGELFVTAGNQQAWYKGLNKYTGVREDPNDHGEWNKSGEWIPYRAGFMLSIPLHKNP